MFRDREDFAIDAERRQWLESPEGQFEFWYHRAMADRRHQAAMILSEVYRSQQNVIEGALKGISGDFEGEILSAEDAIRAHVRKTSNA